MLQRPLQDEAPRLPVLLGHGDEFLIKLGIDFWSDLDGVRHMRLLTNASCVDWKYQDKSRDCYKMKTAELDKPHFKASMRFKISSIASTAISNSTPLPPLIPLESCFKPLTSQCTFLTFPFVQE